MIQIKRLLIPVFTLILLISLVNAVTFELRDLKIKESIELNGKNLTLLSIDSQSKKALVCVNGERGIVPLYKDKWINNAWVSLRNIKDRETARIKFTVQCKKCFCEADKCSNAGCFTLCKTDEDCDDANPNTEDTCVSPTLGCKYTSIEKNISNQPLKITKETLKIGMAQISIILFIILLIIVIMTAIWRKVK